MSKSPKAIQQEKIQEFFNQANQLILDKEHEIKLSLCCLLAGGHLLIEDIPGVGKTTLVKTLSKLIGLEVSRIQFTNDLLPGDIIGSSIFDPGKKSFEFYKGPIFSELILADELNRATPKTQSAFLQAMEERKISIDGHTFNLPENFFIVATQNPRQQIGTFPLPESQLDRFLMRIELGFPSRKSEKKLLFGDSREKLIDKLIPVFSKNDLQLMRHEVQNIEISEAIIEYLQNIIEMSRSYNTQENPQYSVYSHGLSTRAAIGFLNAAKAWAYLNFRNILLPEDIQAVAIPVMSHRLNHSEDLSGDSGIQIAEEILKKIPVDT